MIKHAFFENFLINKHNIHLICRDKFCRIYRRHFNHNSKCYQCGITQANILYLERNALHTKNKIHKIQVISRPYVIEHVNCYEKHRIGLAKSEQ